MVEGLGQYEASLAAMDRAVKGHSQQITQLGATTQNVSRTNQAALQLLAAGAAAVTGLVTKSVLDASKAAIEYETAFAGVRKTVDASDEELAKLSARFIELSKTMPTSAVELAKIGEAAGQLGIQTANIEAFTVTMAQLGQATNLSSTEAAEGLARLANIMGTNQTQFDRLGSTLVDLGNRFAATEGEILNMALRLAGAGRQVGLTEGELLGFATALASVGIEAEAGGTAFSRVFLQIQADISEGADTLQLFAAIAGTSTAEFVRQFKDNAAQAVLAFIRGLDQLSKSGGNVVGALDALELGEIRVRDALLRTSAASALVEDALTRQETAWANNTALEEEARKANETTAAKFAILENRVNALRKEVGDEMNPRLADAAEILAKVVENSGGAAHAIGDTLSKAVVTGAQAIAILTHGLGELNTALNNMARDMAGFSSATEAITKAGGFSSTRTHAGLGFGVGDFGPVDQPLIGPLDIPLIGPTDTVVKLGAAAAKTDPQLAALRDRVAALLAALAAGGKGGGGGGLKKAADDAKTALEEFGISLGTVRQALEATGASQAAVDAAILAMGGTALDTGIILTEYGTTVTRLAAAFTAAGLDGTALTATLLEQQNAALALAAAEKAEAVARQEAADAAERQRLAEEAALKARQAILADIEATAARDTLGAVRSRGAAGGSAAGAATDFSAAIDGFDALTEAEEDTAVATDVMNAALAKIIANVGVLGGEDAGALGVTTDGIRALQEQFAAGAISSVEFLAGLRTFAPELARLGGEIDKVFDAWEAERKAAEEALKTERLEEHARASANWRQNLVQDAEAVMRANQELADLQRQNHLAVVGQLEREQARLHAAAEERRRLHEEEKGRILDLTREQELLRVAQQFAPERLAAAQAAGIGGEAGMRAAVRQIVQELSPGLQIGEVGLEGLRHFGAGLTLGDLLAVMNIPIRLPSFAGGVRNFAGGAAVVGERGPELVMLPPGASVIPQNGAMTNNYTVNANYAGTQSPATIRTDLEALLMLARR